MYGLPKKSEKRRESSPPQIISMSGAVTHDVAKYLNEMICHYIKSTFMVKSRYELSFIYNNLVMTPVQEFVSLDVTSRFTNVYP